MKIRRDELYDFIRSQSSEECYVGLHGIADSSDIKNEYSALPKIEKAKSIMERGLINARGRTTSLTAKFFGVLDPDDEYRANYFNNYRFNSPSGEEVIVVVSIPLFFEDSNGRNLFSGYKEYQPPQEFEINEVPECISDHLFKKIIPPEMILGFYSFDASDEEIEYVPNPNHYLHLSQEKKDTFIESWFKPALCFDVNNSETMEKIKNAARMLNPIYGVGPGISPIEHTVAQYEQLLYERETSHKDIR